MNVNNPRNRSTARTLELLENLRETIARHTVQEAKLVREFRLRRHAANKRNEDLRQTAAERLAVQGAEVDERFRELWETSRDLHQRRDQRLERTAQQRLREMPKRVEAARGGWLGELQRERFRAEAKFTQESTAADTERTDFLAELEKRRETLKLLETKTNKAARGMLTFRGMIRRAQAEAKQANSPALTDCAAALKELEARMGDAERELTANFQKQPLLHRMAATGAASASARSVAASLASSARLIESYRTQAEERHVSEKQRIQQEFESALAAIQDRRGGIDGMSEEFDRTERAKLTAQIHRVADRVEAVLQQKRQRIEDAHTAEARRLQAAHDEAAGHAAAEFQAATAVMDAEAAARWDELEAGWKRETAPLYESLNTLNAFFDQQSPPWETLTGQSWTPPQAFAPAVRFARLEADLEKFTGGLPKDPRLALPGPARLSLPLALAFPEQGSLLLETKHSAPGEAAEMLNNIILRILTSMPPGKVVFTIIDPAGLGQNFAGLMHLSDYAENLINHRIWTEREQIEERLEELSEHLEKMIQMYLRNEYATITDYNAQAGKMAEKYHFLIVADFPANFSDVAVRRLQSIAASGPRCGVFTLIHQDLRQPRPEGFLPEDLQAAAVILRQENQAFLPVSGLTGKEGIRLIPDAPPAPDAALDLVRAIGQSSIDAARVEIPFEWIAPKPGEYWTQDTAAELRVAVGRTGATRQQYLAIGKGTRQHALFAGKTGSGKSTLFHVIITNLALSCSPDQVEFYLIDFKKGVEFKCYATRRLPHARVVAIESDREFALSVLHRVDEELKRRGDLFRRLGVQDLPGARRAAPGESLPRTLLMIDEFQEFFVQDDQIAQTAALLFDRLVRQGRAFGIHVLLGSQTLGGSYSLARSTLGQMVIRVALQCNEADAALIMDENNTAPRLLTRPGEGIYNDAAGTVEGNSPFQVVWLPDEERDAWLDRVTAIKQQHGGAWAGPVVFEGNTPADLQENPLLQRALASPPVSIPHAGRCWLGAPNSIKGPAEASFHRRSGNHLLLVSQRDEPSVTILGIGLLSLAAQYPPDSARFVFLHQNAPGSPESEVLDSILEAIPHPVREVRAQDVPAAVSELAAELKKRTGAPDPAGENAEDSTAEAPPVFVFIHGLHRFRKLRQEDDFSFSSGDGAEADTAAQFRELVIEGAAAGIHLLVSVDSFNNVNRTMNRRTVTEFSMRVVLQMSANDSASLIDSPAAASLGLHRALFYNEQEGILETFRPYHAPDPEWLRKAFTKFQAEGIPAAAGDGSPLHMQNTTEG